MVLDIGMVKAFAMYMVFGLSPGSFGIALLIGDREMAYRKAHVRLKPKEKGGYANDDIVQNMFSFVENNIPHSACGSEEIVSKWIDHKGMQDITAKKDTLLLMKLSGCDVLWIEKELRLKGYSTNRTV